MNGDSRSDRLRERRKSASQQSEEANETGEPSQLDKPSEPSREETQDSVKDQQEGTYMYLPEWQKRELDRLYTVIKADYEYEFDESFEKNRHFYPIAIQVALEELENSDTDAIRDRLNNLR